MPLAFTATDATGVLSTIRMADMFRFINAKVDKTVNESHLHDLLFGTLEEKELEGSKPEVLLGLFDKYLQTRIPPMDFINEANSKALKWGIILLLSGSRSNINVLDVDDFWNLLPTSYKIRSFRSNLLKMRETGQKYSTIEFWDVFFQHMGLFGELLFYCTNHGSLFSSPLYRLLEIFTTKECKLISELSSIRSELGIATYIVYSNWIEDSNWYTQDSMLRCCEEIEKSPGLVPFHELYCKVMLQLQKIDIAYDFFNKFILFLGSESSSANQHFDIDLLNSDKVYGALVCQKHFLDLSGRDKYLLRLLLFIADVSLILYNEVAETICFKNLPQYFERFLDRPNRPSEYIEAFLFEVTQLINFIFVYQFWEHFTEQFHQMCVGVSDVIIKRFSKTHNREPTLRKLCRFPFFDSELIN